MPEMTPSTRELARRIGVTETALRKAEAKGRIEREPDGQWDVEKTRRRLIETADPVRSPLAGAVGAGTTALSAALVTTAKVIGVTAAVGAGAAVAVGFLRRRVRERTGSPQ